MKGVVSYCEGPCTVVKPGGRIPSLEAQKVAGAIKTDFPIVAGWRTPHFLPEKSLDLAP